jgi:hypothetical protein
MLLHMLNGLIAHVLLDVIILYVPVPPLDGNNKLYMVYSLFSKNGIVI